MLYVFFWVIPRRLSFICRRSGTLCSIFIGRTDRVFRKPAYKIQTLGNYPQESIKHSEYGESLKPRIVHMLMKDEGSCIYGFFMFC
jgi:hypothetical protein